MIKNSFNPLQEEEEEENYWSTFMKNSTSFEEFNHIDYIRLIKQVRIDEIRFHQVRLGQITVNLLTNSMSFMIENSFNPLQEEEEENYWSTLMKNSTLFQEFNRTATPQELEIFDALKEAQLIENSRPKRQAGFPGATSKKDNK